MTSMLRQLSRIYKREYDPHRAERLYREYDVKRGYASYSEYCRSCCAREIPVAENDQLRQRGFTWLNILSADEAKQLLDKLENDYRPSYIKKDTKDLQGFHVTDDKFIRETLGAVLTDEVDKQLLAYFSSEYLVHTVTYTMTPRAEEQDSVSFRWHCDKGPRAHLKLIVYLNATEEHGGNTEFIDLQDTANVARHGYLFGMARTRTGSIEHLSKIAGYRLQSHLQAMAAGDGVIFQPATVLHRGVSPLRGARFVITLCMLPSPVPWQEALGSGTLTDLAYSDKWHRNASELLHKFESARM